MLWKGEGVGVVCLFLGFWKWGKPKVIIDRGLYCVSFSVLVQKFWGDWEVMIEEM